MASSRIPMPDARRIFLTFATQDSKYRDLLTAKARKEKLNCTFVEMTFKAPGDSVWQNHGRAKIAGCDAVVAIVSEHTRGATGVLWEMSCAREVRVPILAVSVDFAAGSMEITQELHGLPVIPWKWQAIAAFLGTGAIRIVSSATETGQRKDPARLAG